LIRDGPATAIYVTHRPEEIPRAIQRVLRLSHGRAWPAQRPSVQGRVIGRTRISALGLLS
jgi:hypothetical protein